MKNNKYEETVEILNNMAKVKMAMNAHKGDIEVQDPMKILQQTFNELKELEEAMGEKDLIHIIEEAADVQNFLIAVVHQQVERYRSRKNETK